MGRFKTGRERELKAALSREDEKKRRVELIEKMIKEKSIDAAKAQGLFIEKEPDADL